MAFRVSAVQNPAAARTSIKSTSYTWARAVFTGVITVGTQGAEGPITDVAAG
jgi:hypothetical protein